MHCFWYRKGWGAKKRYNCQAALEAFDDVPQNIVDIVDEGGTGLQAGRLPGYLNSWACWGKGLYNWIQKRKRTRFLMWFASKGPLFKESGRPQPVKIEASRKPSESPGTVWSLPLLCRVNITSFNDQHQLNSQECFFRKGCRIPFHLTSSEQILCMVSGFYLQISEAVKHSSRSPAHKERHIE